MTVTQNQRILDLLFAGKSENDICQALKVSANTVRSVAKTMNVSTLKQRAFDLLSAGHSIDDVADLLGLDGNTLATYANDLTVTATGSIPIGGSHLYAGSGAPNVAGSGAGDFYFRTDTPGTVNQRLYVATGSNTWSAIL